MLSVVRFADLAEAVEITDATGRLSAGIWSRDIDTALGYARATEAETVRIHCYRMIARRFPSVAMAPPASAGSSAGPPSMSTSSTRARSSGPVPSLLPGSVVSARSEVGPMYPAARRRTRHSRSRHFDGRCGDHRLGHGWRHPCLGAQGHGFGRVDRRTRPVSPREPENSQPDHVFMKKRYVTSKPWYDAKTGQPFQPGAYYWVGGNTKMYGACLPRFGAATSRRSPTTMAYPRPGHSATTILSPSLAKPKQLFPGPRLR